MRAVTTSDLVALARETAVEIEDCGATLAMASSADDVVHGVYEIRSLLTRLEAAIKPFVLPQLEVGEPDSEFMQ